MITVAIYINGKPIMARSATNISKEGITDCEYSVDEGTIIKHNQKDGVVKLAIKMLMTIKEV